MKNSHLSEPKIITEKFESWQFGIANAYYEPVKNEIHVLNEEDLFTKTLWHEQAHANRREKPTFRLAQVANTPIYSALLFGVYLVLSVYGLLSFIVREDFLAFIPALFVAGVMLAFMQSVAYEERQADKAVLKEMLHYKEVLDLEALCK